MRGCMGRGLAVAAAKPRHCMLEREAPCEGLGTCQALRDASPAAKPKGCTLLTIPVVSARPDGGTGSRGRPTIAAIACK